MSVIGDQKSESSSGIINAVKFNFTHSASRELYSLLDAVDSKSIADEFDIGKHSKTHDFGNHLKLAVREGLDPSTSLAELADKIETDEQFQVVTAPTFSRYTNDRDYRAVVRFLFEVLHTPQLYHQRAVQRKRLEWLTRGVVAVDATNLELTRSVVVSDEFVGDDEQSSEIDTENGGLELHCAARVDGEHKHQLGATVTEGDTHESPQLDHLKDDVEVFTDLDSIIWVFDRGYTHYHRFCQMKHSDDDFSLLIKENMGREAKIIENSVHTVGFSNKSAHVSTE